MQVGDLLGAFSAFDMMLNGDEYPPFPPFGIAHICTGSGVTPPSPHIRAESGLAAPTSALGLGSLRPHLRRDWAHPCHIRTRT